MKKSISILLLLVMCFGLYACGDKGSAEYREAVREAELWVADVKAYYVILDGPSGGNSAGVANRQRIVLEGMEDLRYNFYLVLSEDEKTEFMDWLSSYNSKAYAIFRKYISTGEVENLL